MKAVVTGGAGFIGTNLVKALIERGDQVTVIDNLSTGKVENLYPDVHFIQADCKTEFLSGDVFWRDEIDVIFHLAALSRIQPSFEEYRQHHSSNVLGTYNMLEAAKNKNAKFIYAASSSVYGGIYKNPYTFTKHVGEEYTRMYQAIHNVPTAIARFYNVYGPKHPATGPYSSVVAIFEKQCKSCVPITVTGDGEQRRVFTHVDDVVSGLLAIAEENMEHTLSYELSYDKNYSINELAAMFKNPAGVKHIPERPGETKIVEPNNELAKEVLGWNPTIDLETYVSEFINSSHSGS